MSHHNDDGSDVTERFVNRTDLYPVTGGLQPAPSPPADTGRAARCRRRTRGGGGGPGAGRATGRPRRSPASNRPARCLALAAAAVRARTPPESAWVAGNAAGRGSG